MDRREFLRYGAGAVAAVVGAFWFADRPRDEFEETDAMPTPRSRRKPKPRDTPTPVTIAAPTGLTADPQTGFDRHHLSWQGVADADYYSVWVNTTETFGSATKVTTDGALTTTTYDYTVDDADLVRRYYWVTASRVDSGVTTTSSPSSPANAAHTNQGTGPNPLNLGAATFWAGYESAGIEVAFTGDAVAAGPDADLKGNLTLHLDQLGSDVTLARYRVNGGTWRKLRKPWRAEAYPIKTDNPQGFDGSKRYLQNIMNLSPGDDVDVEYTFAHPDGINGTNPVTISGTTKSHPPAIGSLTETYVHRYLNIDTGNDSWDGTSATFVSGTTGPWKTFAKVASYKASTSTHLYVHVAPSATHYTPREDGIAGQAGTAALFTNPLGGTLTIVSSGTMPVEWDATATFTTDTVNDEQQAPYGRTRRTLPATGTRAILSYGLEFGPSGATEVPVNRRAQWTLKSPSFVGERNGTTYTDVWQLDLGSVVSNNAGLMSFNYSTTYDGDLYAVPGLTHNEWGTSDGGKNYASWLTGFTNAQLDIRVNEFTHENDGFRSGIWVSYVNPQIIYYVPADDAPFTDPNDVYWYIGIGAPFCSEMTGSPNADGTVFRIEGFEVRGYSHLGRIRQPAMWNHMKYMYGLGNQDGVKIDGDKITGVYAEDALLEYCLFKLHGVRARPEQVPDTTIVPWNFIKGPVEYVYPDLSNSQNVWQSRRVAGGMEGSATHGDGGGLRSCFYRCSVEGLFNGFGASTKDGHGMYASCGQEEIECWVDSIADDAFNERGNVCMLYRNIRCMTTHSTTIGEIADGKWGPMTYLRTIAYRFGTDELGVLLSPNLANNEILGAGEVGIKDSGNNQPQSLVEIVNCCWVTDETNTKIIHKGGSGSNGQMPMFAIINSIFRCQGKPLVNGGASNGFWENHNLWASSEGNRVEGQDSLSGGTMDNITNYRAAGRARYLSTAVSQGFDDDWDFTVLGAETNKVPSTGVDFNFNDTTTFDGLLVDPWGTGDIRLAVAQRNLHTGTRHEAADGTSDENLTAFHDNGQSSPDIGPMKYS